MKVEQIQDMGFEHVGYLRVSDESVDIDVPNKDTRGMVYVWVHDNEVKYLGKAGKGVRKRLKEHKSGFGGGSETGKKHFARMREEGINELGIWARVSETATMTFNLFGETITKEVSLESEEEEFLLENYEFAWNTEGQKKHKKA